LAISVAALATSVAFDARAQKIEFAGAHVDYGIGGAVGSGYGFRQNVDAGFVYGKIYTTGSSIGMWDRHHGTLFGASGIVGFGAYPSYFAGEIGYGEDTTLAGGALLAGPVVRLDPTPGGGVGARLAFSLLIFQAGVRLITIAAPHAEAQLTLLLGVGIY
jgi:hypothetical protein